MTGSNLSSLAMAPEVPPPRVRLPLPCRGCGGVRQKHKQWCTACHAARYPVAPPILTQDWSTSPPCAVEPAPIQRAHCGRWHAIDGLPMRLPCCGMVIGEGA